MAKMPNKMFEEIKVIPDHIVVWLYYVLINGRRDIPYTTAFFYLLKKPKRAKFKNDNEA